MLTSILLERRGGCRYVVNQYLSHPTPIRLRKERSHGELGMNVLERQTHDEIRDGGPDGFDAGGWTRKYSHGKRTRNRVADRTFAQQRSRREDSSASSLTAALTSTSTFNPSTLSIRENSFSMRQHVSHSTTNSMIYLDRMNNSTSRLRVGCHRCIGTTV